MRRCCCAGSRKRRVTGSPPVRSARRTVRRTSGVPRRFVLGRRRRDGLSAPTSRRSDINLRASANSAGVYAAKSAWRSTSVGLHRNESTGTSLGGGTGSSSTPSGSGASIASRISCTGRASEMPRSKLPEPERGRTRGRRRRCPRAASRASPGRPSRHRRAVRDRLARAPGRTPWSRRSARRGPHRAARTRTRPRIDRRRDPRRRARAGSGTASHRGAHEITDPVLAHALLVLAVLQDRAERDGDRVFVEPVARRASRALAPSRSSPRHPAACRARGRAAPRPRPRHRARARREPPARAGAGSRARGRSRDARSSGRGSGASSASWTSRVRFDVSTAIGGTSARITPSSGTEMDQSERISSRNASNSSSARSTSSTRSTGGTVAVGGERPQQRPLHEEALGVQLVLDDFGAARLHARGGAAAGASSPTRTRPARRRCPRSTGAAAARRRSSARAPWRPRSCRRPPRPRAAAAAAAGARGRSTSPGPRRRGSRAPGAPLRRRPRSREGRFQPSRQATQRPWQGDTTKRAA